MSPKYDQLLALLKPSTNSSGTYILPVLLRIGVDVKASVLNKVGTAVILGITNMDKLEQPLNTP